VYITRLMCNSSFGLCCEEKLGICNTSYALFQCPLYCNFIHTNRTLSLPPTLIHTLLISFQSNFFAALDDSDTERKAPTPAVNKKKQAPKKTVVEPSKVEKRP